MPLSNLKLIEEPSPITHHTTNQQNNSTLGSSPAATLPRLHFIMTKDSSHRRLFFKKIHVDGKTIKVAARGCDVSYSTGRRWRLMNHLTGSFLPLRKRKSIAGIMPYEIQDTLLIINSQHRTSFHDELADKLFTESHRAYTRRQISQCLSRRKYVNVLASHLAPVERDLEFRRNWVEQTICVGGPITAKQLLFVDESSKKRRDAVRRRVTCSKGDKITIPSVAKNSGNAASIIASISIEGVQSVTVVDNDIDGNIDGMMFLESFKNDILSVCEPFPGERSVIVMDNAAIHMKHLINAACAEVGVLILYLPPYSFDFNPIELLFNIAKVNLQRRYGGSLLPAHLKIGDLFRNCLLSCLKSPDVACNMFGHCFIPVTEEERLWANR